VSIDGMLKGGTGQGGGGKPIARIRSVHTSHPGGFATRRFGRPTRRARRDRGPPGIGIIEH